MIVDIFVGAVLLISSIIAFIRGFIREVLTIFGVLGGLITAFFTGGVLSSLIEKWITPDNADFELEEDAPQKLFDVIPYDLAADIIAYGGIFIVVVGLLSVVSHFLSESLKKLGLGAVDRSLGVVFGLLRGALLLALLYLPFYMLVDKDTKAKWFSNSHTYVYLEKASGFVSGFLPGQDDAAPQDEKNDDNEEDQSLSDLFGTREKLQQLKVLKSEGVDKFIENAPGYNEDFRDDMNKLFENETNN